jgi:uncharacterized protein (DUF983 family)
VHDAPASGNPYGSLEPPLHPRIESQPLFAEVGTARALLRGFRKRCPRCAARDGFRSWFQLKSACPRCGLRFEKEEGGFLGAMVLNYLVTLAVWVLTLVIGLVLTVPDVPVLPLTLASMAVVIAVPIWFYPRSKMIWAAVEFLVAKSDPDYSAPTRRVTGAEEPG